LLNVTMVLFHGSLSKVNKMLILGDVGATLGGARLCETRKEIADASDKVVVR